MEHLCIKSAEIAVLQVNHSQMTKDISEIKWDIKEIKEHLIDKLPKIYATKEEVGQAKTLQEERDRQFSEKIVSHDKIFNKLVWIVITWVIVFIGTSIINIIKK